MLKGNKFQLDRNILEWEWFSDHKVVIVWITCIALANWKPKKWSGYEIPRGSFITSYRNLAKICNLSTQEVRTALDKLEATQNITRKPTHRFTVITVEKYDDYQLSPRRSNTPSNTKSNKRATTTEEYIRNNNKRERAAPVSPVSLTSEIIDYLNDRTGQNFKRDGAENVRLVNGLIKAGYGADEIKKVIDRKSDEWLGVDHMRYALRPKTLFKLTNFREYLNAPETAKEYETRTRAERREKAAENLEVYKAELKRLNNELTAVKDIKQRRELHTKISWYEDRVKAIEGKLNGDSL